ncbi:MAG: alpha-N-arabinofuranosidase [Candidatus Hydrogenedentes bacterium]|nr:alpha-N-arabinofuranosidase [Candidatus Hydrogenedentota bacterium]
MHTALRNAPLLVLLAGGCMLPACAAPSEARIDASKTGEPVSPYVYGQFIEHLGRCIYGGIWAEMLEDRKFFFPVDGKGPGWEMHEGKKVSWEGDGVPYEILKASPWQIIGPPEAVAMAADSPFVGEHDPVIALDGSAEPRGIYHPRLGVLKDRAYTGYIILKAAPGVTKVEVALQWEGGEAVAAVENPPDAFTKHPFTLTAGADCDDARLAVRCHGAGAVRIGTVSLMPADNVDGFRPDTLAALKELNSPVYRWPGGNFVSGYDWRDGIGDRDKRPPRKNPAWTGVEHNDVGIHEFMRLCELINTEAYIALNTGLGDAASATAEVQYLTGAADTPEGARRAANGRTEPWKVAFWAVGNEMYGDWQLGHMPLEEYVKKHNTFVEAIRAVSPEAKCVGVGSAGKWSETMLTHCPDHMELLSEHLYWQRKDDVTDHVNEAVRQIEELAGKHRGYRKSIGALKGKDIRLALDEWNYWYGPNVYGELGVRYFMRDALGCAAALHALFRNSDLYYMANYAQTVNVIGAIKTTRTGLFFESTGHVLVLYRQHFGTVPVAVEEKMDHADVAAAWTGDRKALTLAVVNTTDKPLDVKVDLKGAKLDGAGAAWTIQNDDPDAHNDENHPDTITVRPVDCGAFTGTLSVLPYSVTLYRYPAAAE